MFSFKKKLKNLINRKQYYNSYYEKAIVSYKEPITYTAIYDSYLSSSKRNSVETTEIINHFSNIDFGSHIKVAKRKIDSPFRVVKNKNLCDIIFYKTKISYHKISIELHFFENKLVFFKYTFPDAFYKDEITKAMRNKYLKKNSCFNINEQLIVDSNKNYLKITDEVAFSIYYMSTNHNFYDFIKDKEEELNYKNSIQKQFAIQKLMDRI